MKIVETTAARRWAAAQDWAWEQLRHVLVGVQVGLVVARLTK